MGDYSAPRSVTFQSGETEKIFIYSATDDSVDDDEETTILRLINARLPQGVTAGTTDTATITIGDNDVPEVTVGFENSYYGVTEGGQVTINVDLSQDPERTVTVWPRTRNQRDTTPDDYSGVPASLTFDAGDTRKSFTVTAAQNDDDLDVIKISLVIPGSYRVQYGAKDVVLLFINESVTTATVPPAPTALRAQAHSQTQINLAWDAPEHDGGSPITGYKIIVSTDHGRTSNTLVEDTANTDTTYEHTGLAAGNIRRYRVAAINAVGTGPLSEYVNSSTRRQVISNFIISGGTTQVQVLNDGTRMAQGFGAGRHGATASALLLKFARWNTGVEVTVSVWTTDQNSDVPKELVMTFTGPDTPGTGEQTFLPDEEWNIVRGHSTRDEEGKLILLSNYLIVIESTATVGAEARLEMTTHTGHEPSGANWGIANRRVSDLTTDPPTTDTEMLRVRIQGAYEAAPRRNQRT